MGILRFGVLAELCAVAWLGENRGRMKIVVVLVALCACVRGGVINGSFEVGGFNPCIVGEFALPGWRGLAPLDGGNSGVVGANNGLAVADGVLHFCFNGGNPSDRGWISQVVSTDAGAWYSLGFAVGRAGGAQPLVLGVGVRADGGEVAGGLFAPPERPGFQWEELGFMGTGGLVELRFEDRSGGNSISDLYLDGVELVEVGLARSAAPVPERLNTAWAGLAGLFLIGCAMVGLSKVG